MHDIKFIRENSAAFDAGLRLRGLAAGSDDILAADAQARAISNEAQTLQASLNETSKKIGQAKAAKDETLAAQLMQQVADIKQTLPQLATKADEAKAALDATLAAIPNLPAEGVPEGADEAGNVEQKRWGTIPAFDFTPAEHFDIGAPLGLDFESAQAVSGARFVYLRGQIARLNRALGQFMLDTHTTRFGFEEVAPPLLVRDEAVFGTAQLPKFAEDLFQTSIKSTSDKLNELFEAAKELRAKAGSRAGETPDEIEEALRKADKAWASTDRRWLIPTAEVSLTNLVRESILSEAELPLRFTALTPCFRSEAGAAGKDTRGLIRQHQFDKVEMVSITTPEASEAEHERMTLAAEYILETLGLPYRRMLLCAGDMGFSATKTFDLEVWLPGQNTYREISSVSNCGDFQARRMKAAYRPDGQQKGTRPVHTLNGSGLAVGRTLVALLENYQRKDGSVEVPLPLRPFMGGIEALTPA